MDFCTLTPNLLQELSIDAEADLINVMVDGTMIDMHLLELGMSCLSVASVRVGGEHSPLHSDALLSLGRYF